MYNNLSLYIYIYIYTHIWRERYMYIYIYMYMIVWSCCAKGERACARVQHRLRALREGLGG